MKELDQKTSKGLCSGVTAYELGRPLARTVRGEWPHCHCSKYQGLEVTPGSFLACVSIPAAIASAEPSTLLTWPAALASSQLSPPPPYRHPKSIWLPPVLFQIEI